jgi:hypothetical protein
LSDIVLKDKNGVDNTYSGVNFVMLRNANGEYDKYITEPQGDLEITENGNFDVRDKATVTVAVPTYITVASMEELNNTTAADGTIAIIDSSGAVNLISFTIDGTSYEAEKGMTWSKWVGSDYNTGDAFMGYHGYIVKSSDFHYHVSLNGTNPVLADDYIQASQYTIIYVSGAGGAN